jgi:dipeptidyl aminopeptidase/acylaminoacyl peptidase
MLAALALLSGCARRAAAPQQLEPTRTAAPRAAAPAPTKTLDAAQATVAASRGGLARENVDAFAERFVRRDLLPRLIYGVAADRISLYNQRAFETYDAQTLRSLVVTPVEIEESVDLYWYALSIDGRRGVIMQKDGGVDVYDLDSGRRIGRFDVGRIGDDVADIALDATGATAVVVNDGRLQRYELITGAEIGEPLPLPSSIAFLVFSRDGARLALQTMLGGIEVHDANTGAVTSLAREVDGVQRIAFSPDGRRMATSSANAVQIWDTATGEEIWGITDLSETVSVAFPPQGDVVALYGLSGGGVFYDIEKREAVDEFAPTGGGRIASAEFATDGGSLFMQTGSALERIDVSTLRVTSSMRRFAATEAAWLPSGDLLAWSERFENGELLLLDGDDGRTLRVMQHDVPLARVMPGRGGRYVATSTQDESIYVWDAASGDMTTAIEDEVQARILLCMSPDEQSVIYYEDGAIVSMPLDEAQDATDFAAPLDDLLDISYCDNARGRLAFQNASSIEVMSLDGRTVSTIELGETLTRAVGLAMSADGRWVGGVLDESFMVWDAETGEPALERVLREDAERVQFLFDAHQPRVLLREGQQHTLIDVVGGGERAIEIADGRISRFEFPVNERLLLATARVVDEARPLVRDELNFTGGAITIWDAESGEALRDIELKEPVYSSAISADGARLALLGYDGSLSVWAAAGD